MDRDKYDAIVGILTDINVEILEVIQGDVGRDIDLLRLERDILEEYLIDHPY